MLMSVLLGRMGGETAIWRAAMEMYYRDQVAESFDMVSRQGVGDTGTRLWLYRFIEAEAITRHRSEVHPVNDWLSLEWIPRETPLSLEELTDAVLMACDDVAETLGWQHGAPTRVTILTEEAHAPWAVAPFGYCQDMYPYEKICVPHYSLRDPAEFHRVVAHEYTHVITLNLSEGKAPRWLHEALSVLVERPPDWRLSRVLQSEPNHWLSPIELESRLTLAYDPGDQFGRMLAYEQAGWIGRYLGSLGRPQLLGDLLRNHVSGSFWRLLAYQLAGRSATDAALKSTYDIGGAKDLFRRAKAFLDGASL